MHNFVSFQTQPLKILIFQNISLNKAISAHVHSCLIAASHWWLRVLCWGTRWNQSKQFWKFSVFFQQSSFGMGRGYTRVMTFREAGWNLRIFFFRAREALIRQADGSGRGSCWRGSPAAVGPRAASAHTRPLSSPWLSTWSLSSRDRLLSESEKDWKLWLDSLWR